jgi:dipeptidyl aminopeptidase/acylaminoacyl peptidase
MQEIPIRFENEGLALSGMMHLPTREPHYPCVVFLHGYTGTRMGDHCILVKAAREFCRAGYACLRFDFRGSGESEGDFVDITVDGETGDAVAAVAFLKDFEGIDRTRVGLLGMSLGGSVAACAAADAGAKSLALWAPWAFTDYLVERGGEVFKDPYAWLPPNFKDAVKKRGRVDIGGYMRGKAFFESLALTDPLREIARYKGPVLIIHGSEDQVVSPSNSEFLYDSVQGTRRLIIIDDADHTFSSCHWEQQVIQATRDWFDETL